MTALQSLSGRLGAPGEQRLFTAARREGINVTRKDVRGFVARQGQRQLFRPLQRPEGKSASYGHSDAYQMDLGTVDGHLFLLVVSVFSRKAYALPVETKEPAVVAPALTRIIDEIPHEISAMTSDAGGEFMSRVAHLLEDRDIAHKLKAAPNDTSVLDRTMQSIKTTIARMLAQRGELEEDGFADVLQDAIRAHNSLTNSAVRDAPNDVDAKDTEAGKVLSFMALRDNAKHFAHNNRLTQRRKRNLEEAGAFRRPLNVTKFKRSFHATYGDLERVQRNADGGLTTSGTLVKGTENGDPIDIKRVQIAPEDSTFANAVLTTRNTRNERIRTNARPLIYELLNFLQGNMRSIESAANHLRQVLGATAYEAMLSGRRLAQIIALFPEDLKMTTNHYYVQPAQN